MADPAPHFEFTIPGIPGDTTFYTNATVELVCKKIPVTVIEMEDVCYHSASGVLLPEDPAGSKEGAADSQEQKRVSGVAALALVFRHAEEAPDRRLLIAGHDDTEGSPKQGFDISKKRAEGVFYLLKGDKEKWSDHAQACHTIKDYQQILRYYRFTRGWACDPGTVDGNWGTKTEQAVGAFFDVLNRNMAAPRLQASAVTASPKKLWPREAWEAVYDLYENQIFLTLIGPGWKPEDAAKIRKKLKFLDENMPFVACGESFPLDHFGKNNFRSQANRRVEFLFFTLDALPPLPLTCPATMAVNHTQKQCPLHKVAHFKRTYLNPGDLNTVLYHIAFEYYDRIRNEVCLVPEGLSPQAFRSTALTQCSCNHLNGVYGIRLFPVPGGKRENDVFFLFNSEHAWVYTKDKKSQPRIVWNFSDVDPTLPKRPITREELAMRPLAERMHYYDLPEKWDSVNWVGKIGQDRDECKKIVTKITSVVEPLVFCLDDMVLTNEKFEDLPDWVLNDKEENRITIFKGDFSKKGPGKSYLSEIGIHNSDINAPWYSEVPQIGIGRNYIWDHPFFTRLIVAQGNLHEVFDRRTPSGARAAVRLVDAPPLCKVGDAFDSSDARLYGSVSKTMAFQPFFFQAHYAWFIDIKENWVEELRKYLQDLFHVTKDRYEIGRCDIALLRFCGAGSEPENAIVFIYLRYHFDFTDKKAPAALVNNKNAQDRWISDLFFSVSTRWNGPDPGFKDAAIEFVRGGQNNGAAGQNIAIKPIVFLHIVSEKKTAHFSIKVIDGCRAHMKSAIGEGQLSETDNVPAADGSLVAAHETGHAMGLADEYIESATTASYYQAGFYSNTPGSPYSQDVFSMMKGNRKICNRHFWHFAEWARIRIQESGVPAPPNAAPDFFVKMGIHNYGIPHHRNAPKESHITFPIAQALNVKDRSDRELFDIFLYPIGDEETRNSLVPGHMIDGIISIIVRINIVAHTNNFIEVYSACSRIVTTADTSYNKRNTVPAQGGKYWARGSIRITNGNILNFARCLVIVSIRLVSSNFDEAMAVGDPNFNFLKSYAQIADVYVENPVTKQFDIRESAKKYRKKAEAFKNSFEHITVTTERGAAFGSQWLSGRRLHVSVSSPQWWDECGLEVNDRIPEMLGMRHNRAAAVTPGDFIPIVAKVLPINAQVNLL